MSVYHPPVLWAQRKDKLYITIDVQDSSNPKLKLEKSEGSETTVLKFSGKLDAGGDIEVLLELNGEVNADAAKVSVTGRHVVLVIPKTREGFWTRLTKNKPPRFVSVDWSKWVDEDDEDEAPDFDLGSMGQFGGLEQFDSDDDEDEEEEGQESAEPSGEPQETKAAGKQETEASGNSQETVGETPA